MRKLGYGLDNRGFDVFSAVQTGSGGALSLGYRGQGLKMTTQDHLAPKTILLLLVVQLEFLCPCASPTNRLCCTHEVHGHLI
jgi:hypothetical protein